MKSRSPYHVTLFVTSLWRIWTYRCRLVLKPDEVLSLESIVTNIVGTTKEVFEAMAKTPTPIRTGISISWQPPLEEMVKLNTDGAARAGYCWSWGGD